MGRDLHLFCEKRNSYNGMWEVVPTCKLMSCWRCDGNKQIQCGICHNNDDFLGYSLYMGRNRELFDILSGSNYSNYYFVNNINDPKGFPEDASEQLSYEYDMWKSNGAHSFSYFTAQEILDFNWNQYVIGSGLVDEKEYTKWKETKKEPEDYYDWIKNKNFLEVTNQEMETHLTKQHIIKPTPLTRIEWHVSYKHLCESFLNVVNKACQFANKKDIRFVFWFDC